MGYWEVQIQGDKAVLAKLDTSKPEVEAAIGSVVMDAASELRKQVRMHARGRPGPRIDTSAYTHSIETVREGPLVAGAATRSPYALRLEFGFHGTDSLGRFYNQPPYPSWRPAIDIVTPKFHAAMAAAAARIWG